MRTFIIAALLLSPIAHASINFNVNNPSVFSPSPLDSGKEFCQQEYLKRNQKDDQDCFPFYNTNTHSWLNVYFLNDIGGGVGVAPKNHVVFYFRSKTFKIKVKNPVTSKTIYQGDFVPDEGLICNDIKCEKWE